jgi:hypothetical protein
MTRAELIERIGRMSDTEIDQVAPYFEADMDALAELDGLRREVELGRASAREEPLIDHADVMSGALARLPARS